MKNKRMYVLLGVLAIFIITNPSVSAFKTYRGRDSYEGLYRPLNLFAFSIYKDHRHKFIGVFGNFLDIGYQHENYQVSYLDSIKYLDNARAADSAKMASDTSKKTTSP